MTDKEIEKTEQEAANEIFQIISRPISKIIGFVFDWIKLSWPMTLLMIFVNGIGIHYGFTNLNWFEVTVFLWFPLLVILSIFSIIISIIYVIGLLNAWQMFCHNVISRFMRGFKDAKRK